MSRDVRVGADVGGTFTDLVTVADGTVTVEKVPSTPGAPADGVVDGLAASAADPAAIGFLGHGTTVATNAVLEGEWADTALVTTEGFADALEIGRQTRPDIYDFRATRPDPVVPRDRRHGVPERLDERGGVVEPLDEDAVRTLGRELAAEPVESVAVATLFAFENPTHERRIAELLRDAGVEAPISLSSTVLPEIREYERTLATALNAGLVPVFDEYVGSLAAETTAMGIEAPLRIMGSNGGLMAVDAARERPVETLLSGPAAGVRAAAYVAARAGSGADEAPNPTGGTGTATPADGPGSAGYDDVLTMDVGGTSCDVSVVTDGEPAVSTETTVGDYPVAVPTVDVHTVGAGGGSIAHVDAGGALRVGPQSAGADPGPVCYGRGGTEPTVTDAHLLLGRLDPEAFVADALDADAADVRAAFEPLADELGQSVRETAAGVIEVANAATERALRVVSVERGHDPREFALVAYGGAGPLHAAALADRLDVPEVIVPRAAGVLSALGLLVSDVTYDYASSTVRPWADVSLATLRETFAGFEAEGREELAAAGHDDDAVEIERAADLRYVGQSFELRVPVPDPAGFDDATSYRETVAERFHTAHRRRYGHAEPSEPVELVTLRLRARGVVEPPALAVGDDGEAGGADGAEADGANGGGDDGGATAADAVRTTRGVVFDGTERDTPVYDRERLVPGVAFDGPAVVEGPESTIVVHPEQRARVDDHANVIVAVDGGDDS
ncbi:hydantoinase/oxoprolinase family protein [Halobaculum sp. MBLA0147]|uniref:hydantoinase/oxoprolinase family protein n=1 Tax=Halobaculum sp. MBLA0147 TaxID=3079934 RepID=UPI0035258BAE